MEKYSRCSRQVNQQQLKDVRFSSNVEQLFFEWGCGFEENSLKNMNWTLLPHWANLMAELHLTSEGSWLKAHYRHNHHIALVLTLSSAVTWYTALDSRLNYGSIMTESVEKYLFCGPNLIELSNCGSRSTPDFWCPELESIYGGGEELRRLVCFTSVVFPMSHSCLHSSRVLCLPRMLPRLLIISVSSSDSRLGHF